MSLVFKIVITAVFFIAFGCSVWLNYAGYEYYTALKEQPILLFKNSKNGDVLVKVPYASDGALFRGVCRPESSL